MAKAKLIEINNAVAKVYDEMLKKSGKIDAALARDVFTVYANAQRRRWMTENDSEGSHWKRLNPAYALKKRRLFQSYPGSGTKMMIATGTLVKAVTGEDLTYHRRTIQKNRMEIVVTLPYAKHANDARNFNKFSSKTIEEIKKKIKAYYLQEVIRGKS